MALSPALVLSSFGVVFVAELPDKTALAVLLLATRHRARAVMLGAGLAFLVQTIVGVAAGSVLTLLPVQPVRIASGIGFLVFAFLAWRHARQEEGHLPPPPSQRPAWLAAFIVIFLAEWGDLTQLATAALVAETRQPLSVGLGAVLALWTVTILAALSGTRLSQVLKPRFLNLTGAVLFAAIGLFLIGGAIF